MPDRELSGGERPDKPATSRVDGHDPLAARTRELDVIQSLGRRAAEAATPRELFATTVSVLCRGSDLDLLAVTHALEGPAELLIFVDRALSPELTGKLGEMASRLLEWAPGGLPVPERIEMESFDPARVPRETFTDDELVVLPILRGEGPIAYLLVLPGPAFDESHVRLLYSAANHVSVHLDRILSSREVEASRFRSILESMPQAVLLTDDKLATLQPNRSARRLLDSLGLEPAAGAREALERVGLRDAFERALGQPTPIVEEEVAVPGGKILDATITPLTPGGGWVVVLTDVTERRKLQQQLAQTEKMSSLGQMISGVAHELNNPLATISGYAQLLRTTSNADRLDERLEVLEREAVRCQRIVGNLLSFARCREPERKPCNLNEVITSVVSLMSYQLRVDDILLESDLDADLPAVHGDTHQLQQVLVNLITNAQQAILGEGRGGTIRIVSLAQAHSVLLEVADTGPGIPEEIRSRIFDPFFTTKKEGEGTGLGLSLVYGIVTSHGGTVEAPGVEAMGATIRITLPLGRPDSSEPGANARPEVAGSGPTGRILVVDDETELARVLTEALAERGHDVRSASDGDRALSMIETEAFDMVISDLKMPGMSGEQLVEAIHERQPGLARRTLLTTGDTLGDLPDQVAERTGLEVLRKPFDLDRLHEHVRRLLKDRRS